MPAKVRFGSFEFDPERLELRKYGLRIRAPDQALAILRALVERPGETVTRARIRGLLWPHGTAVEFEQSINAAMKRLRDALGDRASRSSFIEHVPHQGYRFVAPVEPIPSGSQDPAPDERSGALLLHYKLIERAGSGSMGEVWKAEDTELGRTVALKFVPSRLAADPKTLEAFRQEARHAAALNHPNICTIHGFENHNGRQFLVMEYIDGAPLSAGIDSGPLPAERIVDIAVQAGEALAAAHAAGVVHCDVKPANLMVTADGRIKLTDFGIARALPKRDAASVGSGTRTPAGTLGYLSPEQARGEPADGRSDIFSLGVVLYELATGTRPFRGNSTAAVLESILHQNPVHPRTLNRALPRTLERIILRAIEKDPSARWENAPAMVEALRRIEFRKASRWRFAAVLAGCGAIMVGAALAVWLWMRPAPALTERDSVLVADFENRTGDTVFDGALRQALLSQMGQSPYLRIVSEERIQSTFALMGGIPRGRLTRGAAQDVCQRVGAKAVLAGAIGTVGKRYFVGVEAVSCAGGETIANEYAEAESREQVLTALGRAAANMRRRLGESLASVQKLSVLPPATTSSLEALKIYSIALRERAAGNDPLALLHRAIELDPGFAAAHLLLARIYLARGMDAEGENAATQAYALRGRASERERLAIEGLYHEFVSGDAYQGIAVGTLAAQLYPHDATTWRWSLLPHAWVGDFEGVFAVAKREIETAPDDGMSYFDLAGHLTALGRTTEAKAVLEQARVHGVSAELFSFVRYIIAVLEGDSSAAAREVEFARGKPFEHRILLLEAQTAGYFGQLAKGRGIARNAAERRMSSAPAIAATVALAEAVFGLEQQARERASTAVRLDRGRRTATISALALALTNETTASEAVMADLLRRYPNNTLLHTVWSPAIKGAIALKRGDARRVIEAAEAPSHIRAYGWLPLFCGVAYLKLGLASEAERQFQFVRAHKPRLFTNAFSYAGCTFAYPAAQLGLARALAVKGDVEASRKQYEEFLALWKQADSDIPLLLKAKAEYAALPPPPAQR